MHRIDLKKLDLNLLVVFDMLMHERSVSRAADRLGLTQPAISHALARLRAQIGDPLLVRMGGRMEPTPFAINLDESMRPHLAGLARIRVEGDLRSGYVSQGLSHCFARFCHPLGG